MKRINTTLKQIARELNLSISTVSRALKNHNDISKKTKDLVVNKSKELNYYPNVFAQNLKGQRSNIIGVVVPKISHYFTTTMIEGILSYTEEKGYKIIISATENSHKKQIEILDTMVHYKVDGILLSLNKATENINHILNILHRKPLVLFDKVSNKVPCTQININDKKAANLAVEHLISLGKKRIAIFKENEKSLTSRYRYEGYLKALTDNNLPIDDTIIFSTEHASKEKGREMTNKALRLKNRPDAIFAITDSCAIGAIQVLKSFNIAIPEEIAVVGFSNSEHSTIIEPKLTTIHQSGALIGKTASKYLIQEIEDNTKTDLYTSKTVEIGANLIVRSSSLKLEY